MIDETKQRILNVFTAHHGYAGSQDIRSRGIHNKYPQQLVADGTILKFNHGLYSPPEIDDTPFIRKHSLLSRMESSAWGQL